VLAALPTGVSKEAARKVYRARHKWLAMPNDDATEMRTVMRKGHYAGVDDRLREWLVATEQLDQKTVPISFGLLRAKAVEIGRALKLDDFRASRGYLRGFLSLTGIKSVRLHGQGGAVDKEAAERGMEVVRKRLEAYRAEDIFNMDETGIFFRCVPSQSYLSTGARRETRGVKSMKSKDRVTLVFCTNASGTEKLPIAIIGKSKAPLCFRGAGHTPPVPFFDHSNAWMDATRFQKWFDRVFVPGTVAERSRRVALIMDNAPSHGSEVGHPHVEFIFLLHNSTARHQPMDDGVIAAVKRGYLRRFLGRTVAALGDVVSRANEEVFPAGPPRAVAPAGGNAGAAPGRGALAAVQGGAMEAGGGAAPVPASVVAAPASSWAAPASAEALPAFTDAIIIAGLASAAAVSAWAAAAPMAAYTIIVADPALAAVVPASADVIIVVARPPPRGRVRWAFVRLPARRVRTGAGRPRECPRRGAAARPPRRLGGRPGRRRGGKPDGRCHHDHGRAGGAVLVCHCSLLGQDGRARRYPHRGPAPPPRQVPLGVPIGVRRRQCYAGAHAGHVAGQRGPGGAGRRGPAGRGGGVDEY